MVGIDVSKHGWRLLILDTEISLRSQLRLGTRAFFSLTLVFFFFFLT